MEAAHAEDSPEPAPEVCAEVKIFLLLCMRNAYELHPGEYFLECRLGSGSWLALSRDNDLDVMKTRFDYQVELLKPGNSVRLIDWKMKLLAEKTKI